jgi:hypothetical protein
VSGGELRLLVGLSAGLLLSAGCVRSLYNEFAMNVPLSQIPRLSAALRALTALALVSFVASGCGKLVPSMHFGRADAAADAPTSTPDTGGGPDTRATDAHVDVAPEVSPPDAAPSDARDASPADAHTDAVTPVDAPTPDAPAPIDASTPDAPPPGDAGVDASILG